MPTIPAVQVTNKDRIYNLVLELAEAKARKKRVSKEAGEEVKRIQDEIDELVEAEENNNGQTAPGE
ncbi:MAG: hypothetical protein EBU46_16560 [Nitrosomonadaceae bacterium]|nr:hypothetical protein [Nitrosomonadaceae bacterium]